MERLGQKTTLTAHCKMIFQEMIVFNYSGKCVLTILELNWNHPLGHKKTKLNICQDMHTSSTQLQNGLFHVVERTRTSSKCQKMRKKCTCKARKNTVFHCQMCKFVGFLLPSLSWLLKIPFKSKGVTSENQTR